jgi:hypothetical protein
MARPDYIICLECQTESEAFTWRDGEIRKATCEVCGNDDPDKFALPEDYEEGYEDDEDFEEIEGDEDGDYTSDYDKYEEEDA